MKPTLPWLALVLALAVFRRVPSRPGYEQRHAFAAHGFGKLCFSRVSTLFLRHAVYRLRMALHDFGLRQNAKVAVVVYLVGVVGTVLTVLYLVRI